MRAAGWQRPDPLLGGSAMILKLARAGHLQVVATKRILQEAERNIRDKMGKEALLHYYEELGATEIELVDPTTAEEEARWQDLVAEKDCHVLASAYKAPATRCAGHPGQTPHPHRKG